MSIVVWPLPKSLSKREGLESLSLNPSPKERDFDECG